MERLFPTHEADVSIEAVYRDLQFPESPLDRPYVFLNFVTTLDGQAGLGTGGAAGLGSRVDHDLMAYLRACADGLLHGAGTVRADNFPPTVPLALEASRIDRGLSRQPLGVVVTRNGNLDPDSKYFSARPAVIVTTNVGARALGDRFSGKADVFIAGDVEVDLGAALISLRKEYGLRTLLCEGGPVLAHALLAGGFLDEIFLTIAPKLGSDRAAPRLLEGPAFSITALPVLDLIHVLRNESELFLRYKVRLSRGS